MKTWTFMFSAALMLPAFWSGPANAGVISGEDLYAFCEGGMEGHLSPECTGYVFGALDGHEYFRALGELNYLKFPHWQRYCTPPEATVGNLVGAVVHYIEVHPEERHLPAPLLVYSGLQEAFPCPAPELG